MFPTIHHLDDLLPHIQHKPEITVKLHPNGCTVVCYSIGGKNTFDDEWARECRGIAFDPSGFILVRPMHKFFNIGELEETQVHNIAHHKVVRVMDKRDGSMITPTILDGKIICKTKKSFDTDQAARANAYIAERSNYQKFVEMCDDNNFTPTFEWTSPGDRIVLKYDYDELVLTHIREKFIGTYLFDISDIAKNYNIPVVDEQRIVNSSEFNVHDLVNACQEETNKEGYVVQFDTGDMVKLKTPWYINLHHSVTFTRERDIARMVIEESIDDFKSYLTAIGESHLKVETIEAKVVNTLNHLRTTVDNLYSVNIADPFLIGEGNDRTREFVIRIKDNPYFSLVMAKYNDKEPRYKEFFIKHFLPEYSLEVV